MTLRRLVNKEVGDTVSTVGRAFKCKVNFEDFFAESDAEYGCDMVYFSRRSKLENNKVISI